MQGAKKPCTAEATTSNRARRQDLTKESRLKHVQNPGTQPQKANNLVKKWAKDLMRLFPEHMWQKLHGNNAQPHWPPGKRTSKPREESPPPVGMAISKKAPRNKCWRGCGEKGTLLHPFWGEKLVQLLWRKAGGSLRKRRMDLPHAPALPVLSVCLQAARGACGGNTCTSTLTGAPLTAAKTWNQPGCPSADE